MRQRFLEFVKQQPLDKIPNYDMRVVAQVIGIEKLVELLEVFGGTTVTFPKYVFKEMAKEYVRQHRHRTPRDLAMDTGLSQSTIYTWLRELEKQCRG